MVQNSECLLIYIMAEDKPGRHPAERRTSRPAVVGSAYERCVLWIQREKLTGISCIIHQESLCSTRYVELPMSLPLGIDRIVCEGDLIEAADGGIPFLHLNDLVEYGDERIPNTWRVRRETLERLMRECYDDMCASTELRVLLPVLYSPDNMTRLYELVVPNFYGLIKGFRFLDDKVTPIPRYGRRAGTLVRTSLPDVYRVHGRAGKMLPGNNVAFVEDAQSAAHILSMIADMPSLDMELEWCPVRQKWRPWLNRCVEDARPIHLLSK